MARHAFSKRTRRRVRTGGKGRPPLKNPGKQKLQARKIARLLAKRGIRLLGRRKPWHPRKSDRPRPLRRTREELIHWRATHRPATRNVSRETINRILAGSLPDAEL